MSRPVQHLYVMQNCHGLIKIGRSHAVSHRLTQLESTEACKITLVEVLHGQGDREERVHRLLKDCRIIGEWFDGATDTRRRIEAVLERKLNWPYDLAARQQIDAWLDELEQRRRRRTAKREFGRCLLDMDRAGDRAAKERMRWFDTHIWSTIWRHENGVDSIIVSEINAAGEDILVGYLRNRSGEIVPRYTTVVADGLKLFPNSTRPDSWGGDAWECCKAALRSRIEYL